MSAVFLVSDTHFGHAGVCRFTRDDGTSKKPAPAGFFFDCKKNRNKYLYSSAGIMPTPDQLDA